MRFSVGRDSVWENHEAIIALRFAALRFAARHCATLRGGVQVLEARVLSRGDRSRQDIHGRERPPDLLRRHHGQTQAFACPWRQDMSELFMGGFRFGSGRAALSRRALLAENRYVEDHYANHGANKAEAFFSVLTV